MGIAVLDHLLHVHQMTGIGGQVVLDALFVTDINHDILEDAAGGTVANGNGQSALQHILQQSNGLQAHGFTTGIGT